MYCRKEMVKILNCYLYAKKVMALCLRVQFFWPTLYINQQSNRIGHAIHCYIHFPYSAAFLCCRFTLYKLVLQTHFFVFNFTTNA